ncbi:MULTISPECIES: hypothetical protein [Tenacibaculum]|uniref:hypothetical protein n=1 Tax=Tenacibaculum TaxID=104267 RepID=UPI00187B7C0F|nr:MULTISPECIES: hypothetical protein [Tenacibaculum]MBE7661087.1 hypothetical protein [Tenacibaculum finnmarkense genomovar finnmarkense]MBE7671641.1 hypothetical protein [Tenacibaculum piscium]MCD8409375.1 hypothetical protein [Tenacibaculum finnmarkense genomovar ulcerans]MCD8418742.1 hypothetical protein [Tenacibaculum finnmarkense genomovar finnmarkense]MCG8203642.1 hypothetical protein [Tenacibaculum finnmarkense genomovar finnmarkense]
MKKILLLLIVSFLCDKVIAQNKQEMVIFPFYTENFFISPFYKDIPTTYTDINTVSLNFGLILSNYLRVYEKGTKYQLNKTKTKGNITYTYTSGVGRNLKYIYFKYNIFVYHNLYIIKSLEISGDFDLVAQFYLRAWKTTLQKGDIIKNEWVYNYSGLDKISFRNYKGKTKVIVTNTTLSNKQDFEIYREESKRKYLIQKEILKKERIKQKNRSDSLNILAEKNRLLKRKKNIEKRRKQSIEKKKKEVVLGVFIVQKNRKNIKFRSDSISDKIKIFLRSQLIKEKKGKYIMYIKNINAKELKLMSKRKV